MCGIVGAIKLLPEKLSKLDLSELNSFIFHRGPDGEGVWSDDQVGLAMRRLAIIDIEGGKQPYFNESSNIVVVFNGEIYNYKELRDDLEKKGHKFRTQSDGEVIVHLYEEEKSVKSFLLKLNGMFAFALYDQTIKKLILARDRIGIKPLYYYFNSSLFLFGSEIKIFPLYIKNGLKINYDSLIEYLSFGYVIPPKTIINSVTKLSPGHYLEFQNNSYLIHSYIDTDKNNCSKLISNYNEASEIFEYSMKEVIKRQINSDVPVGLFLSGGIDSGILALLLKKYGFDHLEIFTVQFLNKSFDESHVAKKIVNQLNFSKQNIVVIQDEDVLDLVDNYFNEIDDLILDDSAIPFHRLISHARKNIKVALGGDGGDELFGGYPTYWLQQPANFYNCTPSFIKNIIEKVVHSLPVSDKYLSLEFKLKSFLYAASYPPIQRHFFWKIIFKESDILQLLQNSIVSQNLSQNIFYEGIISLFPELKNNIKLDAEQLMSIDLKTFLAENVLIKVDRGSMAQGLEVRVPYLDNEMINFSKMLAPSLKVSGSNTKVFLRQFASKQFGNWFTKLPKRGFSPPISFWIKHQLKNRSKELLLDVNVLDLNKKYLSNMLDKHSLGERNYGKQIWSLMVLNQFLNKYNLEL